MSEDKNKYIIFTCPHCGGHELKRIDLVSYEMDAVLERASGSIYGVGSSRETKETKTFYKCASCARELSEGEIYENVSRTDVPQNVPRIVIEYSLYTDGDYSLDNCKKWGAVCVEDGDVDYKGRVEFTGSGMRIDAKHFLWEMLCSKTGIMIGSGHHYLLEDFYKMFKNLSEGIFKLDEKNRVIGGELFGNWEGTEFEVRLEGDLSQL